MPEINLKLCDHCGGCSAVCLENAITVFFDSVEFDKNLCNECLRCKKVCPVNAIFRLKGKIKKKNKI